MTKAFTTALQAAIDNAPNEKIAQQLQTLLRRLEMTGGDVPDLEGADHT